MPHPICTDTAEYYDEFLMGGGPAPKPATSGEVLKNLPVRAICQEERCPICQEEFRIGEEATVLPCNHNFHHNCVRSWLSTNNTCPTCRFQLDPCKQEAVAEHEGISFYVDPNETIGDLKARLKELFPGGVDELVFEGYRLDQLEEASTLAQCRIKTDSTLYFLPGETKPGAEKERVQTVPKADAELSVGDGKNEVSSERIGADLLDYDLQNLGPCDWQQEQQRNHNIFSFAVHNGNNDDDGLDFFPSDRPPLQLDLADDDNFLPWTSDLVSKDGGGGGAGGGRIGVENNNGFFQLNDIDEDEDEDESMYSGPSMDPTSVLSHIQQQQQQQQHQQHPFQQQSPDYSNNSFSHPPSFIPFNLPAPPTDIFKVPTHSFSSSSSSFVYPSLPTSQSSSYQQAAPVQFSPFVFDPSIW